MKFEQGKYYIDQYGDKVFYIGRDSDGCPVVELNGELMALGGDEWIVCEWDEPEPLPQSGMPYREVKVFPNGPHVRMPKDKPETIDVANMWVAIVRHDGWLECSVPTYTIPEKHQHDTIAIVTVKDWYDICSGKRELVKGEGL